MGSDGPSVLGELLYRYRTVAGLTQEELAERARLSARAISDLERGAKTRPHVSTVRQLADALQLSNEDKSALQLAARGRQSSQRAIDQAHSVSVRTAAEDPRLSLDGADREQETQQRLPVGGFLGSLPSGRLVARADELARMLGAVETVVAAQGRLLLLAGEPGIGKTRLAQELTRAVHERGFLVVAGRCYEPHQSMPYYPFLEALSTTYTAAPPTLREQASRRWPYLARLMPDHLGPAPAPSDEAEEQERLFRAVAAFVLAVAEIRPMALLVDDLHWADSASLQLLQHLARQTRGTRVLLLGTYRDVEVHPEHPLVATLRDLNREQLVERVPLRRLKESGTAAFITETMGDLEAGEEFVALVHRHTDGNPFFTQQVLQALIENGSVYRDEGRWKRRAIREIDVPESVRSVIGQRISRLRPEAQEILQEASVLGPAFAFNDLVAMKSVTEEGANLEDSVDSALVDAASFGLVRVAEKGMYTFDHALTQQALYTALSPHRRRLLHVAAGEAIENVPEGRRHADRARRAPELAWHFLQGDDAEKATQYSLLAGDQAELVFAHGEAERHYRVALDLAQATPDRLREAEAAEGLGIVLKIVGRYDEGLEMLERGARIRRAANDLEGEGRVVAQVGLLLYQRGSAETGIRRLQPLVEVREQQGSSHSLALLYAALVRLFNLKGRESDQFRATERLLELARGLTDDRLLAEAELHRGVSLMHFGRYEDAVQLLESAVSRAESVGNLHTLSDALNFASLAYHGLRNLDRCLLYRVRAVEVAERLGDPAEISYRAVEAAHVTFLVGDWERSQMYAEQAVASALNLDDLRALLHPLCTLGELCVYTGAWEEASHYLQDSITIAERLRRLDDLRDIQAVLAERELLQGNRDGALSRLRPLLTAPDWAEHLNLLLSLGAARLATGDLDGADDVAMKAIAEVTRQRLPVGLVDALRIQGAIAAQRHKWEDAESRLQRAVDLARDITYPWGEARALYEYGLAFAAKGEAHRAREQLEAASAIFQRLGAEPYRVRADQAATELDPSHDRP